MKNIVLPDTEERSLAFYLAMEEYVANVVGAAPFISRLFPLQVTPL